ncbi:MAG: hypothetical protein [Circular genetic element sp.]|nr:MAG: hypothetical protein [Circular genetic element sp.]
MLEKPFFMAGRVGVPAPLEVPKAQQRCNLFQPTLGMYVTEQTYIFVCICICICVCFCSCFKIKIKKWFLTFRASGAPFMGSSE